MLLIDALNIKGGGCGVLLDYLVDELQQEGIHPIILAKETFKFTNTLKNKRTYNIQKFPSYVYNRTKILKQAIADYNVKTVLCFGHFPLPISLKEVKVFTYFHNSFLLNTSHTAGEPIPQQIIHFLKKRYFRKYLQNSDNYFVQTPLVKKQFLATYPMMADRVVVLPFYNEEKINKAIANLHTDSSTKDIFIYPSSAAPHKNHLNLIKAWEILATRNYFPKLIVTVPNEKRAQLILSKIDHFQQKNIRIKNLGTVSYHQILQEINQAQFCIFPSLRETLGLPLVECAKMGKKILVSNLDYVNHIVEPSITFNPASPIAIANAVETALTNKLSNSKALLKNELAQLKSLLTKQATSTSA